MDTLGNKLKETRKSLNLSLEDVSEKTKIRPHIIKAFEEDNFSILPKVYSKSFIKTYASFLNFTEEEINSEINLLFKPEPSEKIIRKSILTQEQQQTQKTAKPKKNNFYNNDLGKDIKSNIVNYLIYTALGLVIIVLFYFTFFSEPSSTTDNESIEAVPAKKLPDTTVINSKQDDLVSFYDNSDSIILEAKALDTAWMKIDIDGKKSESVYMYPDLEKRWAAIEFFFITAGNAGALEFRRNGELLKPLGDKGTVIRNVKITRNEIINSSTPWSAQDSTAKKKVYRRRQIAKPIPRLLEPPPIKESFNKPIEKKKEESSVPKEL